jgi:mRNA interferase RelE/StbE
VNYTLRILPRAERELGNLPTAIYENVKNRVYALRDNPRPPGCKKLKDHPGWRIRVGNYRVIYEIDDAVRVVTVVHVGHRREVYR